MHQSFNQSNSRKRVAWDPEQDKSPGADTKLNLTANEDHNYESDEDITPRITNPYVQKVKFPQKFSLFQTTTVGFKQLKFLSMYVFLS